LSDIEYLNRKIKAKSFFEIEPTDFFSFGGVATEDDTAQFPECRFYSHLSAKDIRKKADDTLRPPDAESWSDLDLLLQI